MDQLLFKNTNAILIEDPSVNIQAIAKKYGITKIRLVPSIEVNGKHALLIGTEILVNDSDNLEKQRFSIAHEIFHFLTREDNGDGLTAVARQRETWEKQHLNSTEAVDEEIADYFAANLLIPTERFTLWENKSNEEIAQAFGVEVRCIQLRRQEVFHETTILAKNMKPCPIKTIADPNVKLDIDAMLRVVNS